jgi:hypothetical protein
MANWFGTESLLIVCAGMVAVTVAILGRLEHRTESMSRTDDRADSSSPALFRQVRASRQLTLMVLLLTIAVIVEAFIDYQYKFVAKQSIPSKDQLTAFFGSITLYVGIVSLLFQVLFTNRILKRFGVGWAIQLLPASLFVAFLAIGMHPVLWTAALLQLVDGAFSYSIHRSGMELLYLPIPPEIRNAVKGFIDTFVDRAGRAAGAVLLLLFTLGLSFSIAGLSFIAVGLVLVWIVIAVAVKREYMHSFRRGLEKKAIEPEAMQLRDIDGATMATLLALLSSHDERQVLYAVDLLSNTHPNRWRPYIDLLIHHQSPAVRARTIAVLASWNDPAIAREDFTRHPDYETARMATASALRLHWNDRSADRDLLNRLLMDSSSEVAREAITTAGIIGHTEAMPLLIETLANNRLRPHARQALLRFGEVVIPILVLRLLDAAERPEIRKRIPKTLALTGKQQAADALIKSLHRLDYYLDYAVLKALNRMRMNWREITVNRSFVDVAISKERGEYDQLAATLVWLESNRVSHEVFTLLVRALHERLDERLERILRLLGLVYSPDDIYAVSYNYRIKPALRPAAIEFLDNILDAPLKETVVPLLEGAYERERARHIAEPLQFVSLSAALSMLVSSEDPWLGSIASDLERQLGEKTDEGERRVITR